ncbi:hypothetical protein HUT06_05890 [Actinomadura sp. NAK00032]|uniref:hypothetical protein n=1 Tax=Actinomadura sp. NAK00032 TaxID=2742128 RepID=UPI0015920938|nr:hypothetical protein [Actinomadura sp. NAK00032]QKW33620.1 hypothetical protein HUT06_05890 [Actinomadura sp. NAK00032]
MSTDLVALVRRDPDVHAVADGMIAMGERLELRGGEPEPTLLYDAEGRLLVSVEDAVRVSAQSEIRRLLGPEFADRVGVPVWWVDVRAVADVPDAMRVARAFADSLVRWLGGTVYPDGATDPPALSWKAAEHGDDPAGDVAQPGGLPGDAYQGGVIG